MRKIISLLTVAALCFGLLNISVFGTAESASADKLIVEDGAIPVEGNNVTVPEGGIKIYVGGELNDSSIAPYFVNLRGNGTPDGSWTLTNGAFTDGTYYLQAKNAFNNVLTGANAMAKPGTDPDYRYYVTVKGTEYDIIFQSLCDHENTTNYDTTQHWEECSICGFEKTRTNHTLECESKGIDVGHVEKCTGCGYATEEPVPHDFVNGVCSKCKDAQVINDLKFTVGDKTLTGSATCGQPVTAPDFGAPPTGYTGIKWTPALPSVANPDMPREYTGEWVAAPYKLTLADYNTNQGTVTLDPTGEVIAGTKVNVKVEVKKGYAVAKVEAQGDGEFYEDVGVNSQGSGSFTMPAENVTVTVTFKKEGTGGGGGGTGSSKEYRVIVNSGIGGSATADPTRGPEGTEVTVTVKPDEGYVVQAVYAYDEKLDLDNNVCTFTIQKGDANVVALFKPEDAADIIIDEGNTNGAVEGGNLDEEDKKNLEDNSSVDTLPMKQVQELLNKAYRNTRLVETAAALFDGATAKDIKLVVKSELKFGSPRLRANEKNPSLTMDIVGYIQLYAVYGNDEKPMSGYGREITDPITITVSLPTKEFGDKTVYVGHKNCYQYNTDNDNGKVTFKNPHGFSEFKFGTVDEAVVSSNAKDYQYLTFAAAAEEAERDDVLTLKQSNGENVRLPKGVIVKLGTDENGNVVKFSGTINGIRPRFNSDDEYEVETDGRGSGSGSSGNGANGKPSVVPGTGGTAPVEPGNPRSRFLDVAYGAFYFDAVEWAAENGITKGKDTGYFAPNDSCTRAEMVTFLWRAAGSPEPTTSSAKFTDVEAGKYYEKAVAWAVEKGITQGVSATSFAPNATVTRDQTVTFIYRSKGSPAANGGSSFSDVPANAYYANAVAWAVQAGVTNGTSATTFSPAKNCTRGEIVTFLFRSK